MASNRILISGDSIMKGVVLNSETRHYSISGELDPTEFCSRYGLVIENKSRFGSTIGKGLTFLQRALDKNGECRAVILEYGGNDCDFDWAAVASAPEEEHLPKTPLPEFCEKLRGAVASLRARGIEAILTTLPPICSERYLTWVCRDGLEPKRILRWLGDVNAIYRYQEMYSHTVERIAEELDTPLVDLRSAFLQNRRLEDFVCLDGIHPNESGQKIIRAAFSDFAERQLSGRAG